MLVRTTFRWSCTIRRPCFALWRHGLSIWGPRFEFWGAGFDFWRPTFEIRRSDLNLRSPNINSVLFQLPLSSFVCNSLFLGRYNVYKVTCATWSFLLQIKNTMPLDIENKLIHKKFNRVFPIEYLTVPASLWDWKLDYNCYVPAINLVRENC